MTESRTGGLLLAALAWLFVVGCGGESAKKPPANPPTTNSGESSTANSSTTGEEPLDKPLEPFDPPPLAELDAKADWQDRPVEDSLALLSKHLETLPQLATVEEALTLRNSDEKTNAKILSALGRQPKSPSDANFDATITRHLLGDINHINPIMISSVQEVDVSGLLNFGLFSFDWDMRPFAASESVKSWQTSKDYLYDKVVLRGDLTWSDGKPITAHDVAFSFQSIMNPKIPVPAMRSGTEQVRWVHAYDDHTLVFFHKHPLATNVWNINFGILPKHIFEPLYAKLATISFPELQKDPEYQKYESAPISGNAYVLTKRVRGQEIICSRRDDWFMKDGKEIRSKPYFKEVRLQIVPDPNTALLALKRGDLDEMELKPEQWISQATGDDFYNKNTKARGIEWTYFYFGWNNRTPLFDDRRVREAMSYAFDYDEMLKTLLYGLCEPAAGMFYPTAWMAPKTPLKPFTQDLDKAEDLLDEAGWKDSDGDGVRDKVINGRTVKFEFPLLVRQDPERIKLCELLQHNLRQIGVVCNIQPLEATVLQQRMQDKEFVAAFGGWGTGADPDTSENIWTTKAIKSGRNYLGYSNPEVDKLYEEAKREFDRDKRAAMYAQIDEILYRDQPCTFLYFRSSFYGFNRGLRGYFFSPRGPYHYGPGFSAVWRAAN